MKIGIEMRYLTLGRSGGISLLLKEVLQTLFRSHPEHEFIVFCTVFNRSLLGQVPGHVEVMTFPAFSYLAQVDQVARTKNIDVFFRAYPSEEKLEFPLSRQIFLIPDIQHEHFPEFFAANVLRSRRLAFTQALHGAGAIGTISHYARQTLQSQGCTRCKDIFLMSPALQAEAHKASAEDVSAPELELIPAGDFFLYPANLWPHKNHRRILQAFELFLKNSQRHAHLVFTGHPEGWEQLHADYSFLPICHLGFVRDALLRLLLRRARALVFFSLYEGFGMPLLEAFGAGTPVLCSNTTSLPEVGADAVLTCDPTDLSAMSQLMARIVTDEELRSTLVARGKQRLQAYTWERAAENLMSALERVATKPEEIRDVFGSQTSPGSQTQVLGPTEGWGPGTRTPLVSIVTPSYNQGRFLKRTIESVLNQTYPHIEYLVMDGGSRDESVDVLRSYGKRFRWVSEPDNGQSHAINKGLAQARGEILAYLNSDDILMPDAVAKAVAYFHQHPSCDLVYGEANYIDENDRIIGKYNTADYSFGRLVQDCCICQPSAYWRSCIATAVGRFDEQLQYAMDYDYWLRIDRAGGQIDHLHEVLAASRLYPATKTLSARRQIYQEIFQVCLTSAGYVDRSYSYGYWNHLCWEKRDGLARSLRWLPGFEATMVHLHHWWWNRHRLPAREIPRAISRRCLLGIAHHLQRARGISHLVYSLINPMKRIISQRMKGRHVRGFWSDNWLEPTCEVVLHLRTPGQVLHLGGTVPIDMTLTVQARKRVLGVYPLRANAYETVTFPVPPESDGPLVLKFSKYVVDPACRQISFLLQDTNLFAENDVA